MKKDHLQILVEDVNDKLKVLVEGISMLQDDMRQVKKSVTDIPEVKTDIKIIKAAVTDQSRTINNHDRRIGLLERVTS
jgi:prefoldin subunit 5